MPMTNHWFMPPQYVKMDSDVNKVRKRIFEIVNFVNAVSHRSHPFHIAIKGSQQYIFCNWSRLDFFFLTCFGSAKIAAYC